MDERGWEEVKYATMILLALTGCAAMDKFFGGNVPYEPNVDLTPDQHTQPMFERRPLDAGVDSPNTTGD